METIEVTRSGHTDQFSVVMRRGSDTITCMVSVDWEMCRIIVLMTRSREPLSEAKGLAKALDAAIEES
jgi:hypothetical protein